MKTKILLFFCCLFSIIGFTQDSSFQLKDYTYRTSGYKALELSISFYGNTTNSKEFSFRNQTKLFQLFPAWINYRSFFSTDKRWHALYISLSPSLLSHSEKDVFEKVKGANFQSSVEWSSDERFYRNSKWFFQLGNHLFTKGDFSKQSNIQSRSRTNSSGINEDVVIGLGRGRIEMVQDAQMALFILNDLNEQGLLSQSPDTKTVNEFAQLTTQISNHRVFDFRRKRIFELSQIDSFLRQKGMISSPDIRHFAIINDNWALAFNPERLSGSDWFFQLQPSVEVGKTKQTFKDTGSNFISKGSSAILGIGPRAGYENYKPLNLKWQRNFVSSVSWQIQKNKYLNEGTLNGNTTKIESEVKQLETDVNVLYSIGFYPNNRTKLNSAIDVKGTYAKYHDGLLKRYILLQPSFTLSTDYFINYRTRMFANFSLIYNKEYFKGVLFSSYSHRSLGTNLFVGLAHSFL